MERKEKEHIYEWEDGKSSCVVFRQLCTLGRAWTAEVEEGLSVTYTIISFYFFLTAGMCSVPSQGFFLLLLSFQQKTRGVLHICEDA